MRRTPFDLNHVDFILSGEITDCPHMDQELSRGCIVIQSLEYLIR